MCDDRRWDTKIFILGRIAAISSFITILWFITLTSKAVQLNNQSFIIISFDCGVVKYKIFTGRGDCN